MIRQSKANKWQPFGSGGWILIPNETPGTFVKHHQVFIWGETCFSSEIKHLHFNGVLLINTTHGNNENTSENISLHNFWLFHLKRHHGLALSSVSRFLEPNMMKHSPSFFTYYTKISIVSYLCRCFQQGNGCSLKCKNNSLVLKPLWYLHMYFSMIPLNVSKYSDL